MRIAPDKHKGAIVPNDVFSVYFPPESKLKMKWHRLSWLTAALVMVNLITYWVLTTNQSHGLYPTDGDTIIIPIYITAFYSVILFLFFVAISFAPSASFLNRLRTGKLFWLISLCTLRLLLYGCAGFIAFIGAAYWSDSKHFQIMLSCLTLFITLTILLGLDFKELLHPNPSLILKRTSDSLPAK